MSWMGLDLNNSNNEVEYDYDISEEVDSIFASEQLILETARELMGISYEDMKDTNTIKIKIRDYKINNILK